MNIDENIAHKAEENLPTTQESDTNAEQEASDVEHTYTHYSKKDFVKLMEDLAKGSESLQKSDQIAKTIKPLFDELINHEREEALEKFIASGGNKDDFSFREDELTRKFYKAYQHFRDRKTEKIAQLEKEKEKNLEAKKAILEKLRRLVDGEESNASLNTLKNLQEEWKAIGAVPNNELNELWASYHALIDRFYDNRSIYFELKELDRRRNLEAKLKICERAEKLTEVESVSQALRELSDLHEEYKHIGPIPKEEQEKVWQRFKAASDVIYNRKKQQSEEFKVKLQENLQKKLALCQRVEEFAHFQSQDIKAWNEKTKTIQSLQDEWEAVGPIPKEKIKEVSKQFWGSFKQFFQHKGDFFRKIDTEREENLQKKLALCEQAEALVKEAELSERIANQLKKLQEEWKKIGTVPEKHREAIFRRFKATIDSFFEAKRNKVSVVEKEYEENLAKKSALCEKIEHITPEEVASKEPEAWIDEFKAAWDAIGFVPKKQIEEINNRFRSALEGLVEKMTSDEAEREKIDFMLTIKLAGSSANIARKLNKKEHDLRRKIHKLENDIALMKNNLEFFANSKQADEFKKTFELRIQESQKKLSSLQNQLKMLNQM